METWDEPFSITFHASRRTLLQMEKERDVNKAIEELMNHVKELFQKYVE
jgi:hypothetical protein